VTLPINKLSQNELIKMCKDINTNLNESPLLL